MFNTIQELYRRFTNLFRDLDPLYQRTVTTDQHWQTALDHYVPEEFDTFNQQAQFLEAYPSAQLLIEGHCDPDEVAGMEEAIRLGEARARAHRDILHYQCGISMDRIQLISYGRERPLIRPAHNDQERAFNRRTHTLIR